MSYRNQFLVLFLLVLLNLISAKSPSAAEGFSIVERPEEEEIVVAVEANGFNRSDGILVFLPSEGSLDNLLVPLSQFAELLNFAIEVNPGDGMAEGFFIEPTNRFQLDLEKREVLVKSAKYSYQAKEVEAHIDDIYVSTSALSRWFGLDVRFQPTTLILQINKDTPFNFEEQLDRQKRAQEALKTVTAQNIDPKNAELVPYSFYSNPTLIFQESPTYINNDGSSIFQNITNVQGGLDLFGMGANFNASYLHSNTSDSEFTDARLTFEKRDPRGELLGPLKAGQVAVGDVNFPPIPLFLGNQRGSGVFVSSDPELGFKISQQLDGYLLDGDAPVDWDVELYRNGQFIDFQTVGNDGRFRFEDVDLVSGFNRFQIVLFGPEGQRETLTRNVFSGPSVLAEGDFKYNFAVGRPQESFLPFAEENDANDAFGGAFEAFYGVTDYFTLGGAIYTGPEDLEDETTSVSLSASSSLGGISTQLQGFIADDGRNAYQGSARAQPFGLATSLSHTQFNNFDENDQERLKSITQVGIAKNFNFLNFNLTGRREDYLDQEDRDIVENLLSTDIFGMKLSNTLTRTFADSDALDDFEGGFSVVGDLFSTRFRSTLNYDLDPERQETLRNLQLSTQNRLPYDTSLRMLGSYDFLGDTLNASSRLSKQFEKFTLDLDLSGSTEDVYSIGFTVRFGLQPDIYDDYHFVNPRDASLAKLGVRAFVDANGNNIFDEDEETIEKVKFRASKSNAQALTNEEGVAELRNLTQAPTRITINQAEIPSINLVPSKDNIDLIPRTGSKAIINFPFTKLGEIDGFVLDEAGEGIAGIPVILRNLESGEEVRDYDSEYDGYFVFSSLPIDAYEILASYDWFDEESSGMTSAELVLTQKEPFIYDVQLILPKQVIPEELLPDSIPEEQEAPDAQLIAQAAEKVEKNQKDSRFKGLKYPPGFVVQLGSYKVLANAERKIEMLRTDFAQRLTGLDLFVFEKEVWPSDFYNRIYTESMRFSLAKILCDDMKSDGLKSGCLVMNYP